MHKDIAEITAPVADYMYANKKVLNDLGGILGKVRKVNEYHQNRVYNPRVRTDLTIPRQRKKD
jgi:hypothetical protein